MKRVRRSWRWFIVVAGVICLGAVPAVVGALPARARDVAPTDLAAAILASTHPYSGYAEASGRLGLPELGDLDAAAGLLSNVSKVRVWWLEPTAWRVDLLTNTGETDVYGDATGSWTWDSEARRVRRVDGTAPVRLPTAADVLPPALAVRLLRAAAPAELQPVAATRVAGRSVPGVRIVPASAASTIGHADIWADPDTGVPLRVSVVPRTTSVAGFETQFLDVSLSAPSRDRVTFHRPDKVRTGRPQTDIVRQVASASPVTLPAELAGLARGSGQTGAVATYGSGFDVVGVVGRPRLRPQPGHPDHHPPRRPPLGRPGAHRVHVAGERHGLRGRCRRLRGGRTRHRRRAGPGGGRARRHAGGCGMTAVIRTDGLTKAYGRLVVVDDVDLEVLAGRRVRLPRPERVGQDDHHPHAPRARRRPHRAASSCWDGRCPDAAHAVLEQVGALVEGPGFYPTMSGRRNLALFDAAGRTGRRSTRRRRIGEALDRVGLGNVDRRPVRAYSLGMRQRLGLAAALIRQPRLLVLDEPTNGLDPQGIREIRALLAELAAAGTTVFLSSHLLGEVELICTRAAMMAQGRLVAQDSVEHLLAPTGRLVIDTPDVDAALAVLGLRGGPVERDGRPRSRHAQRPPAGGPEPCARPCRRACARAGGGAAQPRGRLPRPDRRERRCSALSSASSSPAPARGSPSRCCQGCPSWSASSCAPPASGPGPGRDRRCSPTCSRTAPCSRPPPSP